jgi:hypothetical protein
MRRAHPHVDRCIDARAMAHGGGIEGGILRADGVDVHRIAQRGCSQHAVGDAHALWFARGPRGVEQPCQIAGIPGHKAHRLRPAIRFEVIPHPMSRSGRSVTCAKPSLRSSVTKQVRAPASSRIQAASLG